MVDRCTAVGRVFVSAGILALMAGCAVTPVGPTVQVMPGPGKTFDAFQADQFTCKGFAAQQVQGQADAANQRAVGGAVLTTLLGAGLGAAIGGVGGNAGGGAAIGAAAGAGGGALGGADASSQAQWSIQQQYDNAFAQCMYAKGEQVPGWAPQTASEPMPAPAPAPVAVADPTVRATQAELIRLGYLKDTADGFIGPKTRTAISSFEQANGLPADGAASQRLLAKLQATPTSAAVATSSAPGGWVAPAGSAGAAAPPAAAPGWVAPAKTP